MTRKHAILTPELVAKVDAKVDECLEIARKKWPDKTFEKPEVRYDVKSTVGGLAYMNQNLIRLNLILCYENEDDFVNSTVPHEMAHLVTKVVYGLTKEVLEKGVLVKKKIRGHGKEWASVMEVFGLPAKRCHDYDVTSIQKSPRKKRGTKLSARDTIDLLRRLENGVKRLEDGSKIMFLLWLETHINEQS